jgi:hypothetical protein
MTHDDGLMRKYMVIFETPEYLHASPTFVALVRPTILIRPRARVDQRSSYLSRRLFLIYRIPWSLNVLEEEGGQCSAQMRMFIQGALDHQLSKVSVPHCGQNSYGSVSARDRPLLKGERRVYAYIHLNPAVVLRARIVTTPGLGGTGAGWELSMTYTINSGRDKSDPVVMQRTCWSSCRSSLSGK